MADQDSRLGTRYATEAVLAYLSDLHAPHDDALRQAFDAPEQEELPAIQIGRSEGKFLTLLLRMTGAKKVVEIGTLAGYSAICLGRGVGEGGQVWTVESEPKHAEVARRNIAAAGLAHRINVVVGTALEVLPGLEQHGPFCAVFIDADKANYDKYGAWAAAHTRRGGLLLGDNAYYFGKLLDQDNDGAHAMRRFHEQARRSYDAVCVPTPDGMLLGIRR
jgi:caffeoyl-CoA O-methyltransferase